jgi:hypothetical protein
MTCFSRIKNYPRPSPSLVFTPGIHLCSFLATFHHPQTRIDQHASARVLLSLMKNKRPFGLLSLQTSRKPLDRRLLGRFSEGQGFEF